MSERERNFEIGSQAEIDPELLKELSREGFERREKAAAEAEKPSIEAIQEKIEKARAKNETFETLRQETRASESPLSVGHTLRSQATSQALRRTRRDLSPAERTFSKVVHQPVVQALSDASEATIARPSGLLVGGIFSVISSLVVLYICRHYGYEYNFLIGLACLAGGFILGVIIEGVYRLFQRLFKR